MGSDEPDPRMAQFPRQADPVLPAGPAASSPPRPPARRTGHPTTSNPPRPGGRRPRSRRQPGPPPPPGLRWQLWTA